MPVKELRVTPKQWIENELKQTISADQLKTWNSTLSDNEKIYQAPITVAGHSGLMSIGISQDKFGNSQKTVNIAFDNPRAVSADENARGEMTKSGMYYNQATGQWSAGLINFRAAGLIQGDHPAKDLDYWEHTRETYYSQATADKNLPAENEKSQNVAAGIQQLEQSQQQDTGDKFRWTISGELHGHRPKNLLESAATVGLGNGESIALRNGQIESVHVDRAENIATVPGDTVEKRTVVTSDTKTELTRTSQGNQTYYEEGTVTRSDGTKIDIKGNGYNVGGLYQVNKREERTAEAVKYSTSKTSGRTTTGIDREIYKNGTVRETRWTIKRGLFGGATRSAETRTFHDSRLAERELGGWGGGKQGLLQRGLESLKNPLYKMAQATERTAGALREASKNGVTGFAKLGRGIIETARERINNRSTSPDRPNPTPANHNHQIADDLPSGKPVKFAGLSAAGRESADKIYRAAHERLTPDQQKDMVASRNEFMGQHKGEGKADALGKLHDTVWIHNHALTEKEKVHLQGVEEKSFEERGKDLPTQESGKWQEAELQKEADRKEKINALQVAKSEIKSLEGQPAPVMRAADRAISARMRQLSDDNHKSIGNKSDGVEMER